MPGKTQNLTFFNYGQRHAAAFVLCAFQVERCAPNWQFGGIGINASYTHESTPPVGAGCLAIYIIRCECSLLCSGVVCQSVLGNFDTVYDVDASGQVVDGIDVALAYEFAVYGVDVA